MLCVTMAVNVGLVCVRLGLSGFISEEGASGALTSPGLSSSGRFRSEEKGGVRSRLLIVTSFASFSAVSLVCLIV
jgi:hypothetical protein